jgi:hypothetical protein
MKRIFGLLLVALLGVGLFTGAAAAAESETIIQENATVTNETDTVWVDATAIDPLDGNTFNGYVIVTGLNDGEAVADGTVISNQTVSISTAGASVTTEYDLTDSDISTYDSVNVHFKGENTTAPDRIASSSWGTTARYTGGGGLTGSSGLLSGFSNTQIGIGAAVLLGGFLLMKED